MYTALNPPCGLNVVHWNDTESGDALCALTPVGFDQHVIDLMVLLLDLH